MAACPVEERVEVVEFRDEPLDERCGAALTRNILRWPYLTQLKLVRTGCTDETTVLLCTALQDVRPARLHTLDFMGNAVGDAGADAVAQMAATCSVTSLSLALNDVGVRGAQALGAMLARSPAMAAFHLSGNPRVGSPGLEALALGLRGNTTLTHLSVSKCGAADDDRALGLLEEIAGRAESGLLRVWAAQQPCGDHALGRWEQVTVAARGRLFELLRRLDARLDVDIAGVSPHARPDPRQGTLLHRCCQLGVDGRDALYAVVRPWPRQFVANVLLQHTDADDRTPCDVASDAGLGRWLDWVQAPPWSPATHRAQPCFVRKQVETLLAIWFIHPSSLLASVPRPVLMLIVTNVACPNFNAA